MTERPSFFLSIPILIFLLMGISLLPWIGAWSIVGAGNVGVVTRLGAVQRVVNPGLVLKLPIIEGVKSMETRTQIEQVDASAASKDLQDVNAKIALNFHLRGENAVDVYQNIGTEYKERIIAPAMQEAFKAITARFTAGDLIAQRDEVKQLVLAELKARLEKYNIVVDDFNIVNFDFSADFNQAIENKVRSQQELEQAQIEARTKLARAQGEVDAANKLQEGGALSPIYIEFLRTQKWNGVLAPSGDGLFLQVPGR